jgi:hypothetical protein
MFAKNYAMQLRYLRLFSVLFFVLFVAGCQKDDAENPADSRAENLKALGTSSEDLLSSDIYKKLVVEIAYSQGFRPKTETIQSFRNFLDRRLNKPGGITIIENVIDPPQGEPYTITEIRNIEKEVRTRYTKEDEIAVFVFFANGNADSDTNTTVTLGTAYQNTSIVIYQETLQGLDQDLFLMEATTLRHEFCHILGLVNIQGDDIHPEGHIDFDNNKHCLIDTCLMYYQSTIPATIPNPNKGDIPLLDDLCLEDLRAKGGK